MSNVQKVNLTINQGATFRHKFAWVDKKGRAINLTDFTARMQIRPDVASATVLHELTSATSAIALGATVGTVSLFIDDVTTASFTWTKGVYDIELVAPYGEVFRLVSGNVSVSQEVTRI